MKFLGHELLLFTCKVRPRSQVGERREKPDSPDTRVCFVVVVAMKGMCTVTRRPDDRLHSVVAAIGSTFVFLLAPSRRDGRLPDCQANRGG